MREVRAGTPTQSRGRSQRLRLSRRLVFLTLALLLVAMVVVGVLRIRAIAMEAVDNAQLGRQELLDGAGILKSGGAGLTKAQADAARTDFEKAQHHFAAAHALTQSRLIRPVGWLPFAGTQLRAGQELADMGTRAAHAGQLALDALAIYLQPSATSGQTATHSAGERVLGLLDALDPRLDAITAELHQLAADRARIPNSGLVPQLARAVHQFDAKVSLKDLEAQLAAFRAEEPAIRALLGASAPRSYLVLQQDPAELRGTGGFIGSVAFLSFDRGKMAPFTPEAVERIDIRPDGSHVLGGPGTPTHVDPPYPLEYVFHLQSWELRDANWSPDFPTAAREAEFLLERETGKRVDGDIAIDPYFIQRLLAITGPITIPETGDVVDQGNFFSLTLSRVERLSATRKDFLSYAARQILNRVLALPPSKYAAILQAIQAGCETRSIQAYFHDQAAEALSNQHHCGGQVQSPPDDGLMVVESNVGGNKDDFWMRRSYSLRIAVRDDGSARHTLQLHYYGLASHGHLLTGYWGYTGWLRIYLPPSTSVVSIDGAKLSVTNDLGHRVLEGWFYVEFGHTADVTLTYDENAPLRDPYRLSLAWQRQAGQMAVPISVDVALPPGWKMRIAQVGSTLVADGPIATDLSVDRQFTFEYQRS